MRRAHGCKTWIAASLLAGCAACATEAADDDKPATTSAAVQAKHVRAVELARQKLAQARLEQEAEKKKREAAVDQAERELMLATLAVNQFGLHEAPLRVRKAELELKEKDNELAENLEEFEQLKLMYAEQDLADKTREMVIHRTERRIAQSTQELDLARAELDQLKQGELMQEQTKLALDVSEKQHALDAARIDARVAWNEKSVAILEAEHELAGAEEAGQATDDDE